jgi:transcriptional regulator with XRE-family HTH domain
MQKRIELILETENLTVSQFADKIGIQRSGMSHILAGRNKPSLDFVLKVLQSFPNLNTDWLLFGKGAMYDKNAELHVSHRNANLFEDSVDLQEQEAEQELKPVKNREVLPFEQSEQQQSINKAETTADKIQPPQQQSSIGKIIVFFENGRFKEFLPVLILFYLYSL